MQRPGTYQYIDSLDSSLGLFKSIGSVRVERDTYGKVKFRSGNSAVVFKIYIEDEPFMLKCYIKAAQQMVPKYEYIERVAQTCDYVVVGRLLPEELFVYDYNNQGEFFDVVLAPWIEGSPLGLEIKWAAEACDISRLRLLAEKFDSLALSLIGQPWAHGDLKPDNIIVNAESELILIDYDAVFVPEFAGLRTSEIGTPTFQHPHRDAGMYDEHIDDYSIAIISVSLHALSVDPTLYKRYNQADNIILNPAQILDCESESFEKIKAMWSDGDDTALFQLTNMLGSASPYLYELKTVLEQITLVDTSNPVAEHDPTPIMRDGLWGYANEHSDLVIDPIYDNAYSFSCGLAAVSLDGRWHFIDYDQNTIINCCEYSEAKPFSCGLAAVKKGGLWGYIGLDRGEVIATTYQMAWSFRENVALVQYNDKYGYINTQGEWYIEPVFDHAGSFKNQRAEVEKDGEVFCIDKFK